MSRILVPVLFSLLAAGELHAQRPPAGPPGGPGDRARLEQRFRARFEQILKERLSLTDAQLAQVIGVTDRLEGRRRELFMEERAVRTEMRDALKGTDETATQERVAQLLDRGIRVQRLRLDLVEAEQRELAAFLSPLQRARYMGLQEQLRRRAEDMRRRAEGDSTSDALGPEPGMKGRRRGSDGVRSGRLP